MLILYFMDYVIYLFEHISILHLQLAVQFFLSALHGHLTVAHLPEHLQTVSFASTG